MHYTTTSPTQSSTSGPSLAGAIGELHSQFAVIQEELRFAHTELDRLRGVLFTWQAHFEKLPCLNLSSLRRHAAFYCHPDRGGNVELMSGLNVLFDILEHSQKLSEQEALEAAA